MSDRLVLTALDVGARSLAAVCRETGAGRDCGADDAPHDFEIVGGLLGFVLFFLNVQLIDYLMPVWTDARNVLLLVNYVAFGLATAYVAAGFRKTGLLAAGIQAGGARKDAILWTRKLANPGGEEE